MVNKLVFLLYISQASKPLSGFPRPRETGLTGQTTILSVIQTTLKLPFASASSLLINVAEMAKQH